MIRLPRRGPSTRVAFVRCNDIFTRIPQIVFLSVIAGVSAVPMVIILVPRSAHVQTPIRGSARELSERTRYFAGITLILVLPWGAAPAYGPVSGEKDTPGTGNLGASGHGPSWTARNPAQRASVDPPAAYRRLLRTTDPLRDLPAAEHCINQAAGKATGLFAPTAPETCEPAAATCLTRSSKAWISTVVGCS